MAIISRLAVILGLDTGEFNKNLGLAKEKVSGFATHAKIALAAVGISFTAVIKNAMDYADKINDTAVANEVSIKSVLALSQALKQNGGEAENSSKLLSSFTKSLGSAIEGSDKTRASFAKLGITLKDLGTLSQEELVKKTLRGLSQVDDQIKRNTLGFELFGKGIKNVDLARLSDDLDKLTPRFADNEASIERAAFLVGELTDSWRLFYVEFIGFIEPALDFITQSLKGWALIFKEINSAIDKFTGKAAELGEYGKDYMFLSDRPLDNKRELGLGDEEKKIQKEIEKQNEALQQQIRILKLEAETIGTVRTEYQKYALEFQPGGKFDRASEAAKQELLNAAMLKDKAIRDDIFNTQSELAEIAQERLKLEQELIGKSDTYKEKQLALFDLAVEIDKLGKSTTLTGDQLEQLDKLKIKTIEIQEETKRMQNTFQAGWSTAFENFKEKMNDSFGAGEMAFESMTRSMENALDTFVETGKLKFGDLAKSIIADIIKMQLKAQASSIFSSLFPSVGNIFGGGTGTVTVGAIGSPYPKFADGGNPPVNQPSIVGEKGPELFIPRTAGTIIPNNQMGSMMGSQPQIVYNGPYIQNMSAIDTQSATQFLSANKSAVWSANQSAQRSLPQSR